MRVRRYLLLAVSLTISLLAVAGFAAFSADTPVATTSATGGGSAAGFAAGGFMIGVGRPVETAPTTTTTIAVTETQSTAPSGAIQRSSYLTEREVRRMVALYFDPTDVDRAVRIAWCESTFNAASVDVRNGGSGLFHHPAAGWADLASAAGWRGADPFDPEANVAVAAHIVYQTEASWGAFSCQG